MTKRERITQLVNEIRTALIGLEELQEDFYSDIEQKFFDDIKFICNQWIKDCQDLLGHKIPEVHWTKQLDTELRISALESKIIGIQEDIEYIYRALKDE